ncbi:hypothetical protein [Kangiella sediminilitoris]|uniref:Uncharacterized protein n=1 Tax=Kangiella sediminilitoris TaxID=1144748 RepID=A0A1B3BA34_9GAMM|nr:hypothetical protein [Kangiella sediminilitoris]AOE49635.1 hypothetical protein KS2013_913 [Kangiella sediminilitoris]
MITFFRHCYYGVYLFFKKLKHKHPDESAFVWMAGVRMLVYACAFLIIALYIDLQREDISKLWITITFFAFEMVVSAFINGKKKFSMIEENYKKLSKKIQMFYTVIAVALMPLLVITMLAIIFHIKDTQGIGW